MKPHKFQSSVERGLLRSTSLIQLQKILSLALLALLFFAPGAFAQDTPIPPENLLAELSGDELKMEHHASALNTKIKCLTSENYMEVYDLERELIFAAKFHEERAYAAGFFDEKEKGAKEENIASRLRTDAEILKRKKWCPSAPVTEEERRKMAEMEKIFPYPRDLVDRELAENQQNRMERWIDREIGFRVGLGFRHMATDGEEVGQLNGFSASALYNVNPWLAVGGQFSGLYGSKTNNFFGVKEDVCLDRYLYQVGVRVSAPVAEPVQCYIQGWVGGAHDINNFSFPGGSSSSSADAPAASVGVGVDFKVTRRFSIGPSFSWDPTFFSGGNGKNRQDNWSIGFNGGYHFGARRGP